MGDCSQCVMYDVPAYTQGKYNLCWAYSQVMVEDHYQKQKSKSKAKVKAVSLAVSKRDMYGNWNKGNWPTNCSSYNKNGTPKAMAVTSGSTIVDLAEMLKSHGPVYAYYKSSENNSAHMVVVTGVNLQDNKVHTNNPWNGSNIQSFDEFTSSLNGNTGVNSTFKL